MLGVIRADCPSLTFGVGEREVDGKKVPGFGYYETIA
jgi:5-oxoprolinase (ATP-hydrolysing)